MKDYNQNKRESFPDKSGEVNICFFEVCYKDVELIGKIKEDLASITLQNKDKSILNDKERDLVQHIKVKPQDPFDSQINKNIDDFENKDSRIDKECFNHVNKESITSQKNNKEDQSVKESKYNNDLNKIVDSLFKKYDDTNYKNKIKKRFGREQDRDLFKRLKTECKKHQIDINEFWKYHGPLKTGLQQFLKDTFPDISFKRSNNFIQKRIRKIGKNVEFSVRERMLLKRLLRKQNDKKNINYSKLEYYLPGKTAEIIKNEINSIYNA